MEALFETVRTTLAGNEAALAEYFAGRQAWVGAVIFAAFAAVNSVRILAYVPQMIRAARDPNGASAVSMTTWGLFLASHLTTIAYAVVCVNDLVMALVFLGNAAACLGILVITQSRRRAHAHRQRRWDAAAVPVPGE